MTEILPKNKLLHLRPTSPINIDFRDLSYSIPQGKGESKPILKNVTGRFKSGQLTAILGPSGCGKTTLLNCLAGYKYQQTTGSILINGQKKDDNKFRKILRYIMQENWIQPLLSVREIMLVAADLKLGRNGKSSVKLQVILGILNLLGLSAVEDTRTDKLSGGELKRLFIALELISNPSVLFLDEPTSGLDDVAAYQCIILLKQLAEAGRTIICSIHAPSARLFSCFQNSYFMSSGQCVYQGCGSQLVSFLSNIEAPCPAQYNPADYILELCSGDYGNLDQKMVSVMENGQKFYENDTVVPVEAIEENRFEILEEEETNLKNNFWDEFKILLLRNWLLQWRNKSYLMTKIVCSLFVGLLVGTQYLHLAEDATKAHFSYAFYYCCISTFMYIPLMSLLTQVPTDMKYLKREHFNRWYNIKSFFSALAVSTLPDQIIFSSLILTPIYVLTGQPVELQRILGFYGIFILNQNIIEGYAVIIGSSMNITNSLFFGVYFLAFPVIAASFGQGEEYANLSIFTKTIIYSSFFRYSFEAVMVVMLAGRRLICPEHADYCIYTDQDYFLKKMSMEHVVVWVDILILILILILVKYLSYYFLKQRLQPNTFMKYVKSKIKIKIAK